MCGLTGFIGFRNISAPPEAVATAMAQTIAHRGPDDSGIWIDADAEIAMAHRRLSIVDLSPAGHQPMHSACERYVLVFNGEIYNHQEIRRSLEREEKVPQWAGQSDTEVLLAATSAWGLKRALEKSTGMFALALFDRQERQLYLARDRLGEKPLYYGQARSTFLFGSEVKALKRHPDWIGEIDRDALVLFLRHNNVPAPRSIYKGIKKLPPATILRLDLPSGQEESELYWDVSQVAQHGQSSPFDGTADEATDHVERLLRNAVGNQMIADVPLGAFLSGGVDSSTVVALMASLSTQPVRTFSIGFDAKGYNEAHHANSVARHLRTDHTELYVTERDALDVIPRLPEIFCEPFADSSQIPTFLVSKLARQSVTVSLSGDGGDELFSGYTRYRFANTTWPWLSKTPLALRRAIASAITAVSPKAWNRATALPLTMLPQRSRLMRPGDQIHKAACIVRSSSANELYRALISQWQYPASIVIGGTEPTATRTSPMNGLARQMMFADLNGYLPNDILVKVDRAAMAVGLETRVPMLDHRVVEFSCRLPHDILTKDGQSKWPLRKILDRYVPRDLIDRPKMGFGVPIDTWLRGDLREWAEDLLCETRLLQEGFFNPGEVREAWSQHLSGQRNMQYQLWCVLMFQAWNTPPDNTKFETITESAAPTNTDTETRA
jgi:asparagine synthase (glutamine-hydrolysing)